MRKNTLLIGVVVLAGAIVAYVASVYGQRYYYNRGTAHLDKGRYDKAISCFNKAIGINPDFAQTCCSRGTAHYRKGQTAQAIADFDRAILIDPELSEAYYSRAVAYYDSNDLEKARIDIEKAQALGHPVEQSFLEAVYQEEQPALRRE